MFHRNVDPFERCSMDLDMTANMPGPQQILCTFNAKELNDLTAVFDINVEEEEHKPPPEDEKMEEEN